MKLRLRRPLAMLLTVVMLLGLLPTAAFAVEGEESGEPVTASAPKDITLKNAECEVGDEVTLDGTTTVSDDGTLSYQWYQSGDDFVDEADAADEEKNDTLLEEQTGATLTVDTSEAGTFYYYVIATNTVTLADGTTVSASTASNVAMVTVKEAEPGTTGESSEAEDGQEPPADSTPENEQTPGNGDANGEPGNTDPNGDPNGGEPEQGPVEPGDGKASDAKITSLLLKDFTPFGGSGSGDLNLLVQKGAIQWDLFSPYTLEIGVSLPAGATDNKLTLTLPEGMKFVNLNPDNITGDGIKSASWKKGEEIYTYQPDNGTLTVNFTSSAEAVTVSVSIQPDGAFFPPEKHEEGHLIENAIQVQVNDDAGEKSTVAVDVDVKTSLDSRVPYIGDGNVNSNMNTAAGGTVTLEGHVYTGWLSASGSISSRLIDQLSFSLEVPENFTVENVSGANVQWSITKGDTADGKTIWKFSTTDVFYSASRVGRISITAPANAQEGTYPITVKEVSAKTYGQNEPMTKTYQNTTLWTVAVKSPDTVEVQVEGENFSNVLNYTAIGNEEGTFDDYNSLLTAAVVTNEGLQAVKQSLIYEAEFDQVSQFITAVGIPCGWGKEGYMPTSITVTYEDSTSTTLTENEIETVAALATDGYGFVLRGEDIPGYQENSIAKIKVELPGLPQNYKSSASPYFSEGNAYNTGRAYAGAWGRVRDGVGGEPDATNKYCIYLADGGVPAFTEIKTTYKNQSRISDETITATLTVGGTAAATVNSGGLIHVSAPIRPSGYINPFRSYEASLLDPVIYLLEPEDLSIENVKITTNTGAELTYRRTEITGQHTNLPNGYKLYEYTLADKLMLGWWDADWNSTTLNLEFDYRVDTAAQTRSYDLRDLILFKSSLNLPFARYGVQDTYNLNGENDIGTVRSNTFTVQAATDFNIATAIQIDGENKWYSYDPGNPASTTSVFTEGATANVRVTVTNNSGETANNTVVYIPVPKKGQASMLGEHFIRQAGFDMFIADKADLTGASGWDVQYGQVTKVTLGNNNVPTGEFTLEGGDWSDEYDENTNMIKLTLSSGMANGASAEIILQFKATEEVSQTDSMNIFKSWYKYATEKASMVDTDKVYNFGTLLQNGKLDGTVYLDANRNGVKNEGETGIEGVTVKVVDEDGRTYETQTGEGGAYSFNSLPGNKTLTLTVTNPSSPDPNNIGGSYRFYGGDVTPAEDNRSASKSDFTLTDGTATVNAGLIEPYTVTFLVAGGDGTTSFVNPSSRKIYAGQKLNEVTERVTVSLAPGLTFENKWTMLPSGGESSEVQHNNLLNQTVTADTTFTAITSSVSNIVTAMWWDTETNSIKQQFSKDVDWNKPVGSNFPEDSTVNNRPGYNFVGWSVNGTDVIKRRDEIINAAVTGAVNYIAQYKEKTDITVTLNANGGTFDGSSDSLELSGLTYGGVVNNAAGYKAPTREDHYFVGWADEMSAESGTETLMVPTESKTYYAVWAEGEPENVTVSFDRMGGEWTESGASSFTTPLTGKPGAPLTLPDSGDITRTGYDFGGWYTDYDCSVPATNAFPSNTATWYAKWIPHKHTVTYDYNDGKVAGSEETKKVVENLDYDSVLSDVPAPQKPGYELIGWRITTEGRTDTGYIIPSANMTGRTVDGDITYEAYYVERPITVTFNANRYDSSGPAQFGDGTTQKLYQNILDEEMPFTDVPVPSWEGYVFVGWEDDEGNLQSGNLTFTEDTNYYARWEEATFTVTYRLNGGTVTGEADDISTEVTYKGTRPSAPAVTLPGSTLSYWLDMSTGNKYAAQANEEEGILEFPTSGVTSDEVYLAIWNTNQYTVTFTRYDYSQTGEGYGDSSMREVPTIYNGTPAAPAVVPRAGQAFDHWLMTSPTEGIDGQTEFTANELLALKVTQDMTFQAVFKATDYTVTFDANGGQFAGGSVPTYSVAYNAELSTAEDFAAPTVTKTGSEFRGWTKTGDDTLYTNNAQDGNYIGKAVITSDTVFIASWSGDVRVTFNANGGTISGADYAEGQAGTAISSAPTPTPTPTRYGYTFGGWYKDIDCEVSAAESDGTTYLFPTTNATWYAKWTAKDVMVVFDYGEGKAGNEEQKKITKPFGSTLSKDDIPAPTLAGSTLTGWSREDGTIIPNSNMTSEVIGTEGIVTYTAYYTANPITITFDPNGGTFPDGSTEAKTYQRSQGGTMPFADVPVPTRDAQTFAGWKLQGAEDSTATTTGSMTFDTAKTYVAVWTDAEYTITFRLNGGTVDGNTADVVESANHGDDFPDAPAVTLSGNTLQGWLNMADGEMYGGSNQAFPETVTESATYIAIWGTNTYKVTFTKYDYSDQDTGDSRTLTIPTIYQGIPAAPTVTPPTGRQFTGWKITSGSLQGPDGSTLNSSSEAITSAELTQCKVIGAVTLEAQYSDPTYTVTFIPGEGAQLSEDTTYKVTNGKTMADMNFTVPTASKDGATSTSWICSLDGEAMTADEIKELVINSDVTFTAVWVGDVTVSFVLNGGKITNNVPASVTGAPGTEVTVPLVEQDGYTFEGWYDAETGGNPVTFTDNKTTIGDTSVTYYARWTQNSLTVEPATQSTPYTGIPALLTWTVKDQQADSILAEDDYDVTYFNQETGVVTVNKVPTEAGTYTVTFRGKDSYLGKTATATYTITRADLSSAAVTVTYNRKTYNGSEQYASVTVNLNGTALIMGQDFTVTYDGNCVDAGSYSITVNGIGNYKGEYIPTEQLTIAPKELQDGMIQAIPPQYYTGQKITPKITVHDGELVLHEGTDFENVTYSNSIDVGNGTASVSITGKGNYTGDAKATFSIIAKSTYLEVSVDPASATYGDELSGMTITVTANGTILTEYEDYQLSYQRYNQDGQPEEVSGIDEAGVYIITATGEGNYDGSKGSTVFILYPQDESDGMLVIGQGNIEVEYDGQNHLPAGFVVQWNDGSGTLVDLTDADYELLYSYNNSVPMELVTADTAFINVGIYVVTVKATGNYSGIATFVVTITPKDIAGPDVDVFIDETTYNAGEQTADITVTDGGETLTENVDYTVSDATYTDANEDGYEVLITGMGNYTGSRTELFIIHRAEITVTTNTVSITYGDPLPDISTIIPSVSGIYDADAAGVTVTLAWPTDLSAGTHELTASLSGDRSSNYVVDASGALLIVSAKDMNGADSGVNATLNPDYGYYTGSPLTPNVVVTDSKLGTTLTEGRDYTVSYEDSSGSSLSQLIDLGVYTVVVTGKGNYTGTFELAYTIKDKPSGGGDGGGDHGDHDDDEPAVRYVIRAEAGRGGDISPDGRVRVDRGDDQTFRITADEGYEIADVIVDGESVGAVSSYTFENVRKNHTISVTFTEDESVADPDDTGVSGWLNTKDHIQYLSGYGGGKFGPTDNMTRAQAAQMFYNLLLDQDVPITVSFTDVAADAWYAKAVNTLASLGIVDGIGDNHYAPERAITRAEFTVIAMRFAHLDISGENIFSDVTADAWYYDYVVGSIQYGWINGYEDGTFRPNNTITRSEVTAIVNRMLGRSADKVFVDRHADELTQFSDVPGSYWAYYEIMEAANAHDYVKDNGVEDWTRLQ